MGIYKINKTKLELAELNQHKYRNEGRDKISPQYLIAKFPSLILSIPELEIAETEKYLVVREFNAGRGPIDVLIITENSDIIIVETKLYRNPESHRTVVAQAIDYAKALSQVELGKLKTALSSSKFTNQDHYKELFEDSGFESALDKNLKTGNFAVLIVGDKIHANVLNMVEAIQSAPHLAFTIYLAEIQPYSLDDDNILIQPTIVAKTDEVERSVIKLEIDYKEKKYTIESSAPEKEGKGNKPLITQEQFLESISKPEFVELFKNFWRRWKQIGGDIRCGSIGVSHGLKINGKREGLFFFYDDNFYLLTSSRAKKAGIDEKEFNSYIESIKKNYPDAYDLLMAGKAMIKYDDMSTDDLKNIFNASMDMAEDIQIIL